MYILVTGLNHRTAPVEIREKLAFTRTFLPAALRSLRSSPGIAGCVILSTCNRTEIYAAATDVEQGLRSIRQFIYESCGLPQVDLGNMLYVHTIYQAVRHLFRVTCGLDSMILGETQILGQVREAFQTASANNVTNAVLNTLFQQAITIGKKVRTITKIDQHAVSISYAAVELAKQELGQLSGCNILIIGAGKMGQLTLKHLAANSVQTIMVSNRSYDRAQALAHEVGGRAVNFSELFSEMQQADVIISCTAANHLIINRQQLAAVLTSRRNRGMLIIDIAVPRDVDPAVATLDGVILYDVDDLQSVIQNNMEERKKAAVAAEELINDEITLFFKWLSSLFAVPTIMALKQKGEAIKEKELERAYKRLGAMSPKEKQVISSLASSIVNQLLHDPIINLKEYAATQQGHLYTEVFQNVFGLEVEGEMQPGVNQDIQEGK